METTRTLPRIFKYGQLVLDDPDPDASPDEVVEFYSEIYTDLRRKVGIDGPDIEDDAMVYTIRTEVGTKGGGTGESLDIALMESLGRVLGRSRADTDEAPLLPPSSELPPLC